MTGDRWELRLQKYSRYNTATNKTLNRGTLKMRSRIKVKHSVTS